MEEPLMKGILLLPPQGMLSQLKKSWHKKYCQLFKASHTGIQRLEIYDTAEEAFTQSGSRIITLEACIKILPSTQSNVLSLMTKTGTYHFGCTSEADLTNWKSAIQSVAFKDDTTDLMVEEDNDLYCTSGDGIFTVKIAETDASRNCRLEVGKNYTLVIGATDMKLMDLGKTLYTWPYQFIRKYGYRNELFTFEAGRKCDSGEGAFCVEHKNQLEIYKCFVSKKKLMKQMLNGDNSPSVECNDVQFQAALSMEAGSRSPLPPSNLSDLDMSIPPQFSSSSQASSLSLQFSPTSHSSSVASQFSPISQPPITSTAQFSSNSQPRSVSPISPPKRPVKPPLPAKPKRIKSPLKPVVVNKSDDKLFNSESKDAKYRKLPEVPKKQIVISSQTDNNHYYDDVEIRNQAWKPYGVSAVSHSEGLKQQKKTKDAEEEMESRYEKVSFPVSQNNSIKSNSSSIIHNVINPNDHPDYDKLQHFGSIHKSKKKSGFRTPSTSSMTSSIDSNVNNYDLAEKMNTVKIDETPRYSLLRKQSNTSTLSSNTSETQHKGNDTEYALVSKPKRV